MLEMFASTLGFVSFCMVVTSVLAAFGKVTVPENSFDVFGYTLTYTFTKDCPYSVNFEKLNVKKG